MKSKIKLLYLSIFLVGMSACNDFEEVNTDPTKALEDQISVEALLNSSIADAQLTYWERDILFIRTWSWGGRYIFRPIHGPQVFNDYSDYMADYWSALAQWINNASIAIRIGNSRIEEGSTDASLNNYVQMARIWRAHLFSEAADMFGPYPAKEGFQGENPSYDSVEEVYAYVDSELKDAVSKLNVNNVVYNDIYDAFYAGDISKWVKYGNSLRLRCAMRFSRVGNTGKTRFEETLANGIDNLILDMADNASIAQASISTTDDAGSVFDCDYIGMQATTTISNIGFGIGGIKLRDIATASGTSAYKLPEDAFANAASPNEYLGMYMPDHLPNKTNVETVGYFFDKLPNEIDPRILAVYHIPGHNDGNMNFYPNETTKMDFPTGSGKVVDLKYTFFTATCGDYTGKTDFITVIRRNNALMPGIGSKYRRGQYRRMFFSNWETYFLLAEAAHYGWNTGKTSKEWYELGVKASFEYHELSTFADAYLQSEDYNRLGTSAKFDHTNEIRTMTLKRKVYDTGAEESVVYNFPKSIAGTNNDQLTKIMTQKYIAQCPWLPQEATNDYRRTGRPFFENPCLEGLLPYMNWYTDPYETNIKNVYRRVRYPVGLSAKDPEGYAQSLELLGGADKCETPLIWHMQ